MMCLTAVLQIATTGAGGVPALVLPRQVSTKLCDGSSVAQALGGSDCADECSAPAWRAGQCRSKFPERFLWVLQVQVQLPELFASRNNWTGCHR